MSLTLKGASIDQAVRATFAKACTNFGACSQLWRLRLSRKRLGQFDRNAKAWASESE